VSEIVDTEEWPASNSPTYEQIAEATAPGNGQEAAPEAAEAAEERRGWQPFRWARFLRGGFLGSVVVLAGGTVVGQAILVLASPILTRLYTPEDLGLLGLFTSFLNVAVVAVTLRYEGAIVAAQTEDDAAYLIAGSLIATVIISAPLSLGLYVMIQFDIFSFGTFPIWTVLLAYPALVLTALFTVLRYWFLREQMFGVVTKVFVIQSVVRTIVQVALGLLSFGWAGLFLGDLAGRGSGNGRLLRLAWADLSTRYRQFKLDAMFKVLKAQYKYPVYNLPSTIINTLVISLPIPMISGVYGAAAAGFFTLVQRVLSLPLSIVGRSVADAFHSHLAVYARDKSGEAKRFFLRAAAGLALVGLVPTVVLALFGPQLFRIIFGPQWIVAGEMAAVMAPWALAQLIISPLSRTVLVIGGQELKLVYDFIGLGAVIVGIYGGYALGFSLIASVALFSWLQVIAYAVYFFILLNTIDKYQRTAIATPPE